MGDVTKLRQNQPTNKILQDDDRPRMVAIERLKIEYCARKLDIDMIDIVPVKWPWQATATAKDLGVVIDSSGEVRLVDDDLEAIQKFERAVRRWTFVFNIMFAAAGIALGLKVATFILGA